MEDTGDCEQTQRSASTISRELRRNTSCGEPYAPHTAQGLYALRRRRCKRKSRLDDAALAALVSEKLLLFWSPEQIAGRLARDQGRHVVSFVTIYRAIQRDQLPHVSCDCLRRRGRKYSPSESETRGRLHGYKSINERPLSAERRSCYGHWEGDTVRGALNKGCLATFVDRRSRFLVAGLMADRKAAALNGAMEAIFASFPLRCAVPSPSITATSSSAIGRSKTP